MPFDFNAVILRGLGLILSGDRLSESRIRGSQTPHPASLSHPFFDEVIAAAGLAREKSFGDNFPHFHVAITQELLEISKEAGLIYGYDEKDWDSHYYLKLLENGRLFIQYQQIIGSREIGVLTPTQMTELKAAMAQCLRECHGQVDLARQRERKTDRPTVEARPASAGTITNPPDGLVRQLRSLIVHGNRISLPKEHLPDYAKIRKIMQQAGGKYKSGGFDFASAVEAQAAVTAAIGGTSINIKKDTQFFATPPALAEKLVDSVELSEGERVLDPSAGHGALTRPALDSWADVVMIENWPSSARLLEENLVGPHCQLLTRDFMTVSPEETGLFDAVVMNPPFTRQQDITHIKHALSFLKPDGRLAAIASPGFQTTRTKAGKQFRDLLALINAPVIDIPAGAFSESGTQVRTVMMRIDMPTLLNQLEATGQGPEDYGLDLSWTLLAQDLESVSNIDAKRQAPANS